MKRSSLGIGAKSLARGSTFAAPRKPLRSKRRPTRGRPTDEQIESRDLAAERGDCWLAQFASTPCSGIWELAHLIPKERLRFYGVPEDAIWDPRVVRAVCGLHHDEFDETGAITLTRDQVPADTEEFANTWGLSWLLDREYGSIDDVQTAPEIAWPPSP